MVRGAAPGRGRGNRRGRGGRCPPARGLQAVRDRARAAGRRSRRGGRRERERADAAAAARPLSRARAEVCVGRSPRASGELGRRARRSQPLDLPRAGSRRLPLRGEQARAPRRLRVHRDDDHRQASAASDRAAGRTRPRARASRYPRRRANRRGLAAPGAQRRAARGASVRARRRRAEAQLEAPRDLPRAAHPHRRGRSALARRGALPGRRRGSRRGDGGGRG